MALVAVVIVAEKVKVMMVHEGTRSIIPLHDCLLYSSVGDCDYNKHTNIISLFVIISCILAMTMTEENGRVKTATRLHDTSRKILLGCMHFLELFLRSFHYSHKRL